MSIRKTVPSDAGGKYYYDSKIAEAAVKFPARYLRLFEGEWAGKPMEFLPWFADIVRDLWGWRRASDGTRRFRVVYVWIPRKNAKSTNAAAVALMLLVGDAEPGGQVYCIASTEDQAQIVFRFASNMVNMSPELSKLMVPYKTGIWCESLNAVMRPLTGKAAGKHGLNASGVIGDEIHEWPSDDLYTFVRQSEGTRRQPMDFLISTAGKRDGVGWEHYQLCEAILNGEIDAEDTYVYIASADAKRDAEDPTYWTTDEAIIAANPSLGMTVKLDFVRSEIEKARQNPRKQNDVKRYLLNLWVDQAVLWLDMERFDRCGLDVFGTTGQADLASHPELTREALPVIYKSVTRSYNHRWAHFRKLLRGRRCYVGVDLSSTTDLTCAVYVFPPDDVDGVWYVYPRFFLPRGERPEDLKARVKRDKFDYEAAEKVGALVLTDGDVIDYDAVFNDIIAHSGDFDIAMIGLDRWNATQIANQLTTAGFEVVMFGQGFASMSGPTKFLERIVLQKRLDHGGQPVFRWNARNVAVAKDAAENVKPVKDKSTNRIDGIVGAIIAIGIGEEYQNDGPSVYEERGIKGV